MAQLDPAKILDIAMNVAIDESTRYAREAVVALEKKDIVKSEILIEQATAASTIAKKIVAKIRAEYPNV